MNFSFDEVNFVVSVSSNEYYYLELQAALSRNPVLSGVCPDIVWLAHEMTQPLHTTSTTNR